MNIILCYCKQVKTVYRSSLSQDNIEAFVIMATERSILNTIDTNIVIGHLAKKGKTLEKLLTI